MKKYEKIFKNELGNEITVRVNENITEGVKGVSIFISGPTSETENNITLMEAEVIYEQLGNVINDLNNKTK